MCLCSCSAEQPVTQTQEIGLKCLHKHGAENAADYWVHLENFFFWTVFTVTTEQLPRRLVHAGFSNLN